MFVFVLCAAMPSDGWCRYNLEQELVPSRVVEVVSVKSFNRLPFEDGSMDIVTLPFVTSESTTTGKVAAVALLSHDVCL